MKTKIIFIIAIFLHVAYFSNAISDTTVLTIKKISVIPNSISKFYLLIDLRLDLDSQTIDDDYFHSRTTTKLTFNITYQNKEPKGSCIITRAYASHTGFGIKVSGFTDKEVQYFLAKDNGIGVKCDRDFIVRYYSSNLKNPTDNDYKYGIVKADDINQLIQNSLTITDSDRSGYITAVNNYYYHDNKIDFGVEPGSGSANTTYFLTADIRNKYAPGKFFSCNDTGNSTVNKPRLFWSLSTRLSTNFSDSLNFIKLSPINLSWSSLDFSRELNLNLTNESDQTFTNKRISIDGSYRCIIPNLVNLTTQQDNRLRLKPIVNVGIKGYEDYSNNITAFISGQAYLKGYYYIPVYNNYSIIIDGSAFYDFSNQRNPDHKIADNY